MGVLIDASVLIQAERGKLDIASRVQGREEEEFFISVITASELLHGVWRVPQRETKVRAKRVAFVEGVLSRFPLLPVDLPTARIHAQLWAHLEAKGISVGPHDGWLAASCIAHGLSLATGNVREFKRIPGLAVEDWLS